MSKAFDEDMLTIKLWESAVPLAFHLRCFYFSAALVVRGPFPFGVWGRMWNSIVSVPDHCLHQDFVDAADIIAQRIQRLKICSLVLLPVLK